jgi:ABC-2 type transport system permease protein
MTFALVRKLLRDLRVPLLVVALLLAGFECLWVKVTERITNELLPALTQHVPLDFLRSILFQGSGKILQALIGGEAIHLDRTMDVLSIGYIHPLTQTILCVWAIGRAAGAIAGEIDRGTMELLLAQPVARYQVVLAQLWVDLLTIPVLCLSLWGGTWLGAWLTGLLKLGTPVDSQQFLADPLVLVPALWQVAALVFAVGGYTMWLSARGRLRGRVMGVAVVLTLLQFIVNVVGQLWDGAAWLRPLSVFYYFQPQQVVLSGKASVALGAAWKLGPPFHEVNGLVVLLAVGALGYGLALWTFCRRELPAPL